MTKGWCPEEDIYDSSKTTRRVSMTYQGLYFTLTSIATYGSARFENVHSVIDFPSNHACKFNVD